MNMIEIQQNSDQLFWQLPIHNIKYHTYSVSPFYHHTSCPEQDTKSQNTKQIAIVNADNDNCLNFDSNIQTDVKHTNDGKQNQQLLNINAQQISQNIQNKTNTTQSNNNIKVIEAENNNQSQPLNNNLLLLQNIHQQNLNNQKNKQKQFNITFEKQMEQIKKQTTTMLMMRIREYIENKQKHVYDRQQGKLSITLNQQYNIPKSIIVLSEQIQMSQPIKSSNTPNLPFNFPDNTTNLFSQIKTKIWLPTSDSQIQQKQQQKIVDNVTTKQKKKKKTYKTNKTTKSKKLKDQQKKKINLQMGRQKFSKFLQNLLGRSQLTNDIKSTIIAQKKNQKAKKQVKNKFVLTKNIKKTDIIVISDEDDIEDCQQVTTNKNILSQNLMLKAEDNAQTIKSSFGENCTSDKKYMETQN